MTDHEPMRGKTVAITGCTGGLGRELCLTLAGRGAHLVMLDRNQQRSEAFGKELSQAYPSIRVTRISCELEDMDAVRRATEELIRLRPDFFVANAGAYSIPRHLCTTGYDNLFQINFVSPYYMARRLSEAVPDSKIVAVGSIAHTYSKINGKDMDFRTYSGAAKAYGNSKRFLMLSLGDLFRDDPHRLAIVHPGITFTNITAHYPKVIFAIIKHPMKIIFMKPKNAVHCLVEGLYTPTPHGYWIGPALFDVWGKPKMKKLKAATTGDHQKAAEIAESIYQSLSQ